LAVSPAVRSSTRTEELKGQWAAGVSHALTEAYSSAAAAAAAEAATAAATAAAEAARLAADRVRTTFRDGSAAWGALMEADRLQQEAESASATAASATEAAAAAANPTTTAAAVPAAVAHCVHALVDRVALAARIARRRLAADTQQAARSLGGQLSLPICTPLSP